MLEKEYDFYKKNEKEFLKKYPNKYIVIKNNSVLGVYDSIKEAMTQTLKENELGTFLVNQVKEEQQQIIFRSKLGYA